MGKTDKWEEIAHKEQTAFCFMLGDRRWDKIKTNENLILRRKIGYGLYGLPSRNPDPNNISDIGYTSKEDTEINKIHDLIIEEGKQYGNPAIWFACIFVSCKLDDDHYITFPVFRILKDYKRDLYSIDNCTFIDPDCRVYQSWDDFLNNNKLPSLMIYPKDGIYQVKEDGNVYCIKSKSTAGNTTLEILDYVATGAGIAAAIGGLVAIFALPVVAPIAVGVGLVSGLYGAGRSSAILVDRYKHKQDISLNNEVSRNCWLSIVTTPLFFTEFGMLARMRFSAQAGNVLSKSFRVVYSAVNVASFTTNGLGIINSIAGIIEKGTPTSLDIFQLTASCIFFGHSSMNLKTASKIIKGFQEDHINSYKKHLSTEDERRDFDNILSKMQRERQMDDSAKIIKELNYIEDKEDFIHSLIDMDRRHNFEKGDIKFDKGLINLLDEWYIHPRKLGQIEVDSVLDIKTNTKKFQNGEIDLAAFKTNLSKICSKYRLRSESMRSNTISKLATHFHASNLDNVEINGVKIFKDVPGHDIDRLNGVMENTAKNYKPEIIDIAMKFARKENCENLRDFCNYLEYAVDYMNKTKNTYIKAYGDQIPSQREKIVGKVKVYFENKVYNEFKSDDNKINEMAISFHQTKEVVSQANQEGTPNFKNDNAAAYHYVKHASDLKGDITPRDYLNIAREIAKGEPKSTMLSQEGNVTFLTFENQDKVMVIGIQPRPNGELHIATCYASRKK